jgi:predicted O-linked N-acetylglucosamine transferase (SPINDLY family)
MPTLSDALAIAVAHHQAGRLDLAEEICRRILAAEPQYADALHLLGVIAHERGQHEVAVVHFRQAAALCLSNAEYANDLGVGLVAAGKTAEAVEAFQRALQLNSRYADAYGNLGKALAELGRLDEAVICYRQAAQLRPDDLEAALSLGAALLGCGEVEAAAACYRRSTQLKPDSAEAHLGLGTALEGQGNPHDALLSYRRALELKPDYADAYNNLGALLHSGGQTDDAISSHQQAIRLKPDYAEAHCNLGIAFQTLGRHAEAIACYHRALELKPDYAEAHVNLGNARKDQGELRDALDCYRRAMALKPDSAPAHSNLLYTLHFCPDYDSRAIYLAHREWEQQHAAPLAEQQRPHANDRSPDRRLRVGYVSPDFRDHVVGRNLLPLFREHNRQEVEVFCYSDVLTPDHVTAQLRSSAAVWRSIVGLNHEQLADLIRQDAIDVLVDLTLHMAGSRLLAFARKPAPVQVTYLGYCSTTGLNAIDYRLTDPFLELPSGEERLYAEQSICLPETYWCYEPPADAPPVNAPPACEAGHVTFGCLNNFCKVTQPTLVAWCRLLKVVPRSRLLLHAHPGSHRDRVRNFLAEHDVSPERLSFVSFAPIAEYMRLYQQIDIALDPFPCGGGITTCDALWMGVPVVSLVGNTAVGRAGFSILSNVGLPELAARDTEQYVDIAVAMAQDLPRLADLRTTLRDRMRNSPLMDASRFARNVEAAYRAMWCRWCQK